MNTEQLIQHLRKVHGIPEGTIYDPYLHDHLPALCFGSLPSYIDDRGPGQALDPVQDLMDAAWEAGQNA